MSSHNFANSEPDKNSGKPIKSRKLSEIDLEREEPTNVIDFSSSPNQLSSQGQPYDVQPSYLDLPLKDVDKPEILCGIRSKEAYSFLEINIPVTIASYADYNFTVPAELIGFLFHLDYNELEEAEDRAERWPLVVTFPFLNKPIKIWARIGDELCISLEVMSKICSGVEFKFREKVIRLHEIKHLKRPLEIRY